MHIVGSLLSDRPHFQSDRLQYANTEGEAKPERDLATCGDRWAEDGHTGGGA